MCSAVNEDERNELSSCGWQEYTMMPLQGWVRRNSDADVERSGNAWGVLMSFVSVSVPKRVGGSESKINARQKQLLVVLSCKELA